VREYSLKNALAMATKYTKPQPVSQLFSALFDENIFVHYYPKSTFYTSLGKSGKKRIKLS
jgi:hypothetical protein